MPGGFSDQELSEKARRFRVLIIGRANSGKTTILKKICNTTDDPIVYDDRGKRISNLALKPTRNRGMHDIESEISFRSSPQFVFHDSRGFEAGGKEEMEKVKTFISERSKSKKLQDQIHVIWYCIPMDNDRPVTHAEEEFFSKSVIKKVPVVLIFTKCEALQGAAVNKLQNQGLTWEQAVQGGPEHAEEILNMVNEVVKQKPYPPQAHICLQELNQPHTTCHDLVKHTAAVLTSKNLQALFISTQQNSLELAMEYSIRHVIKKAFQFGPNKWPGKFIKIVFSYFPYHNYHWQIAVGGDPFNMMFTTWFDHYDDPNWDVKLDNRLVDLETQQNITSLATLLTQTCTPTPHSLQYIQLGAVLILMAENLTISWTHAREVSPGQLARAIHEYQQSSNCTALMLDIDEAFRRYMAENISSGKILWGRVLDRVIRRNPERDAFAANLFDIILKYRL